MIDDYDYREPRYKNVSSERLARSVGAIVARHLILDLPTTQTRLGKEGGFTQPGARLVFNVLHEDNFIEPDHEEKARLGVNRRVNPFRPTDKLLSYTDNIPKWSFQRNLFALMTEHDMTEEQLMTSLISNKLNDSEVRSLIQGK